MPDDRLSIVLAALADPTRRAILARLANGETTVNELAEPFEISLPGVSKHLKVLERAGLVARGRAAQWRPVSLRAEPLQEVAGWIDTYRKFWEQSLDRLDDYLRELQAKDAVTRNVEKKPAPQARKTTPHGKGRKRGKK